MAGDGTAGHLASAAAGARALGLPGAAMTNALGMAAAQASGIRKIYGTDAQALQHELNAKLRSIAVPRIGVHGTKELLAGCWELDLASHASDVLRHFRHPD